MSSGKERFSVVLRDGSELAEVTTDGSILPHIHYSFCYGT